MDCDRALLLMQKETLSSEEREALYAHLETCAECRNIYHLTCQMDEAVASLEVDPPERLVEGTMWKIAPSVMEKRTGKRSRRRFPFAGTAIAAVAAAALLVIGWNQFGGRQMESTGPDESALCVRSVDAEKQSAETDTCADEIPEEFAPQTLMPSYAGEDLPEGYDEADPSIEPHAEDGTFAGTEGEAKEVETAAPSETSAEAPSFQSAGDGTCIALMWLPAGAETEVSGTPVTEKMMVLDAKAWWEATFGTPSRKLDGYGSGICGVRMFTLTREELEQLQEDYPEAVEVIQDNDDWTACTLVVMEDAE